MKPYRELLPANIDAAVEADPQLQATDASSASSASGNKKRAPQTRVACSACRRKRTKCDGRRPICSTCAATIRRPAEDCEYDAEPDLTRTAALKKKNGELHRRSLLLEQLFHLLTLRSEDESIEIIRRMRTTNLDTDLDNLVSFIKSGDLLMMFRSVEAKAKDTETSHTATAEGAALPGTEAPTDEATALLEKLFASMTRLDQPSRTSILSELRSRIDELEVEGWPDDAPTDDQQSPLDENGQSSTSDIDTAPKHQAAVSGVPRR